MQRRAGLILTACVLATCAIGCASTGGVPRPFPVPGGSPPPNPAPPATIAEGHPASALDGNAVVGTALALRGAPYRNGGGDPAGFDCSGFTQYVYAQYGVSLPREVREQYRVGTEVRPGDLAPGDLIFFSTTEPGASHVAIAMGGDQFVHAPSSSGVVRVERMSVNYWSERLLGARRVN